MNDTAVASRPQGTFFERSLFDLVASIGTGVVLLLARKGGRIFLPFAIEQRKYNFLESSQQAE
jgi:hypothetical protein